MNVAIPCSSLFSGLQHCMVYTNNSEKHTISISITNIMCLLKADIRPYISVDSNVLHMNLIVPPLGVKDFHYTEETFHVMNGNFHRMYRMFNIIVFVSCNFTQK
jgi:hypothetical protein